MNTERSAGIILFRIQGGRPKVLLLHYDAGHWDFPKGKLEPGETEMEAAIRELQEETGITQVEILPEWKEQMHYFYMRDGEGVSKTVLFFLGLTKATEVKLSDEHQGFDWLSPQNAEKKLTFENAKKLLRLATPLWKK